LCSSCLHGRAEAGATNISLGLPDSKMAEAAKFDVDSDIVYATCMQFLFGEMQEALSTPKPLWQSETYT
jgi:hypothetical protein